LVTGRGSELKLLGVEKIQQLQNSRIGVCLIKGNLKNVRTLSADNKPCNHVPLTYPSRAIRDLPSFLIRTWELSGAVGFRVCAGTLCIF
jgi:hypothetical protein